MDVLWGGETQLVDLAYGIPAPPVPAGRQGYLPVFFAHALDALAGRLQACGLEARSQIAPAGTDLVLADPHRHRVLLREPAPCSS